MNKVKLLTIVSICLLVINLGMLWFIVSHKPGPSRKEGPKKMVIEKLQLDASQTQEYEKMIEWHKSEVEKSEQQMLSLKNQLYLSLKQNSKTDEVDSVIADIGKIQKTIEHTHYKHFEDIKTLCKPEQLALYDKFCEEIAKLFAPGPPRKNAK